MIAAKIDKSAIRKKIPETPILSFNQGEITKDNANVRPIDPPTIAIAFVRCSSRVRSDNKAVKTAEIAPAP